MNSNTNIYWQWGTIKNEKILFPCSNYNWKGHKRRSRCITRPKDILMTWLRSMRRGFYDIFNGRKLQDMLYFYKVLINRKKVVPNIKSMLSEYSKLKIICSIGWHGNCELPIPRMICVVEENEWSITHIYSSNNRIILGLHSSYNLANMYKLSLHLIQKTEKHKLTRDIYMNRYVQYLQLESIGEGYVYYGLG